MILKQGHKYLPMPHDGKLIAYIYRGGRCYYIASPYSPEATQALKAAFPQYWTAIRDYGYAHPQLVPFINEDPMLIVSLVEVGKTRWLVGDGNAWIDTGVVGSIDLNINMIVVHHYVGNGVLGTINTKSKGANRIAIEHYAQGPSFAVRFGNKGWINGGKIENDTEYDIVLNKDLFSANGNETPIGATTYSETSNIIFPSNEFSVKDEGTFVKYRKVVINSTTPIREMYPFIRNGENGMLDILSGTFHPNANTQGAFTIEVTDKA